MKNKLYRLRYFQSHQIERFSLSKCYFIQKSRGAKSMLTQNYNSILQITNSTRRSVMFKRKVIFLTKVIYLFIDSAQQQFSKKNNNNISMIFITILFSALSWEELVHSVAFQNLCGKNRSNDDDDAYRYVYIFL